MNAKTYLILAMVMVLSIGFVSAGYDLTVSDISIVDTNPKANEEATVRVIIENVGDTLFDASGESVDMDVDFGDSATDGVSVTQNVPASGSITLDFAHTYTTKGTYSASATLSGMAADDNNSNDELTTDVVIPNTAPEIVAITDMQVTENTAFSQQVDASDHDGDALSYSLTASPSGMTSSAGGLIQWASAAQGTHTVTVEVSDGTDATTESFVLTVVEDVPRIEFTTDSVLIGGPNQDRGEQVIVSFTVQNTGTQTLSNIAVDTLDVGSSSNPMDSEYKPQAVIDSSDLAPGETRTGTLTITVPVDANSKEEQIGQLKVIGTATNFNVQETIDIDLQAKSYLRITEVEVEAPNDDDSLDDGDTFSELKEGDKVTLFITVENIYSDSSDIEIQDVEVEVDGEESDWDIGETSSSEDIPEDDDYTFEVSFVIGDDIDEDATEVTIEVTGTNDDPDDSDADFEHYDVWTIDFEIDRPEEELSIKSAMLSDEVLTCDTQYVDLDVEVKNSGSNRLDDILIEVESSSRDLDFDDRELYNDDLRSGKTIDASFRIPVPQDLESGFYLIDITAYFDNDEESDDDTHKKSVMVEMVCDRDAVDDEDEEQDQDEEQEDDSDMVIDVPNTTEPTTPPAGTGGVVYGEKVNKAKAFRASDSYIYVLGIIVVILLLVVIGLLARLGRK